MEDYRVKFKVENGEGELFWRQEDFHIVALEDYDVEETVLWQDRPFTTKRIVLARDVGEIISWETEVTTAKQIAVVSKQKFTVVINRQHWAISSDGEKWWTRGQEVIQARRGF
ncbi:MAG: hypothetical protein DDT19_02492 [Syntrophomonadaceae bacterium]|nr:hypothetical protein [Bacillota bacterium]